MRVSIDIPDQVWWAAVAQFERQGTTTKNEIEALITSAALDAPRRRVGANATLQLAPAKPRTLRVPTPAQLEREEKRSEVLAFVRAGHTDQEISVQTGLTRKTIGEIRRREGLPSNRPRTKAWLAKQ